MARQIGQIAVAMVYADSAIADGNCEYGKCRVPARGLYRHEDGQSPFLYRACCPVHAQLVRDGESR